MEKHTPTPWEFDPTDMKMYSESGTSILTIHRRPKIVGQDDIENPGLSIETKANAELTRKAVNSFADTQDLLKEIRRHGLIEKDGYENLVKRLGSLIIETN